MINVSAALKTTIEARISNSSLVLIIRVLRISAPSLNSSAIARACENSILIVSSENLKNRTAYLKNALSAE